MRLRNEELASQLQNISSAIVNMTATRQMATILAFVALLVIHLEPMATVLEKGSILGFFF